MFYFNEIPVKVLRDHSAVRNLKNGKRLFVRMVRWRSNRNIKWIVRKKACKRVDDAL